MITIPVEGFTAQGHDNLAVICEALFLEYKDNRMISVLSDETFTSRVETLREHDYAEPLFEMVQFFGEDDFVKSVLPCVEGMVKELWQYKIEYKDTFTKHFKPLFKGE